MSYNNSIDYRPLALIGGSVVLIIAFFVVVLFGSTAFQLWWAPHQAEHEHNVNVHSHQYQEARKESSLVLESNIAKLNTEIDKTDDPKVKESLKQQREVLERRYEAEQNKIKSTKYKY